ncbi:uncharacterized protein LOC132723096 [Ruditapes philippinarum]|uniref:uncharacterized protein LOC132723096 n=1 Tax=Ruditapes philippinarum TaxID=129788 RepID=UPI00295A6332|nr:uncharacterized protein LOC132723096 [Ruditapes philippinarum]
MSDSGWSNVAIFQQYLEEHFLPYAKICPADKQKIFLIYDDHSSQKSPQLINWARERGLILFLLPAHTSHMLQPLDVAVFGPFKNYYYSECSSFMSRHIGQIITRYELCSIACKAYTRAMSPSNIQSAFRKTGIFPIDPAVVSMEKLFPCESFREEKPVQKVKSLKTGKAEAESFLIQKEENKSNNALSCSKYKVAKDTRPDAGGRAITNEDYVTEIDEYSQQRAQSTPVRQKPATKPRQ